MFRRNKQVSPETQDFVERAIAIHEEAISAAQAEIKEGSLKIADSLGLPEGLLPLVLDEVAFNLKQEQNKDK